MVGESAPNKARLRTKWGFGDAPLKPKHREKSIDAIEDLLSLLEGGGSEATPKLDSISHVKGLFSRVVKQDQWDWSTVWRLLGRPSTKPARRIAQTLAAYRRSLSQGDSNTAQELRDTLLNLGTERYLESFLNGPSEVRASGNQPGYIYILSTRDRPNLLKIGFTTRTVEERVKEINSANGVIVQFGIRSVWEVDDTHEVERELHDALSEFRVRSDREFFELDYREAMRLVNQYLHNRRRSKHS